MDKVLFLSESILKLSLSAQQALYNVLIYGDLTAVTKSPYVDKVLNSTNDIYKILEINAGGRTGKFKVDISNFDSGYIVCANRVDHSKSILPIQKDRVKVFRSLPATIISHRYFERRNVDLYNYKEFDKIIQTFVDTVNLRGYVSPCLPVGINHIAACNIFGGYTLMPETIYTK